MNEDTLSNKVNTTIDTHNLFLGKSVSIQNAASDYRILQAFAQVLGHVAVPLGQFAGLSDMEELNLWAHWQKELGETAQEFAGSSDIEVLNLWAHWQK